MYIHGGCWCCSTWYIPNSVNDSCSERSVVCFQFEPTEVKTHKINMEQCLLSDTVSSCFYFSRTAKIRVAAQPEMFPLVLMAQCRGPSLSKALESKYK